MNILIYGKRRQGKSTLALALACTHHSRVAVFDPNDQFPLVEAVDLDGLLTWRMESSNMGIVSHGASPYDFVRVGPMDTDGVQNDFTVFTEALASDHEVSVIVDEAHMLQGQGWVHPDLDRWNRRSSGDVCVIQTTHRIVDAHPDSRYHADHVFFSTHISLGNSRPFLRTSARMWLWRFQIFNLIR